MAIDIQEQDPDLWERTLVDKKKRLDCPVLGLAPLLHLLECSCIEAVPGYDCWNMVGRDRECVAQGEEEGRKGAGVS